MRRESHSSCSSLFFRTVGVDLDTVKGFDTLRVLVVGRETHSEPTVRPNNRPSRNRPRGRAQHRIEQTRDPVGLMHRSCTCRQPHLGRGGGANRDSGRRADETKSTQTVLLASSGFEDAISVQFHPEQCLRVPRNCCRWERFSTSSANAIATRSKRGRNASRLTSCQLSNVASPNEQSVLRANRRFSFLSFSGFLSAANALQRHCRHRDATPRIFRDHCFKTFAGE